MEVVEFKEETLGVSSKTEVRSRNIICPARDRENIWLCKSSHCASMGHSGTQEPAPTGGLTDPLHIQGLGLGHSTPRLFRQLFSSWLHRLVLAL